MTASTPAARGTLYIVSAPSGAGKTSLVAALLETVEAVEVSVSHTTRKPRASEVDGQHYHFVSAETFLGMIEDGQLLEHAKVFDNFYGTARASVDERLDAGVDVILEIDWQGARQVRAAVPDAHSIFILPPSRDELERRLRGRGQDEEDVIQRRLRDAESDCTHFREYDYTVVNADFDEAVRDLACIFRANRLRTVEQETRAAPTIGNLLAAAPGSA
ncbi:MULTISPECIES: guanylate kinase [unclassified Thioalkalivibrio]|uniref:guanylate kinase n=1 Tax=unclassified Thioalkalivibrio TaxID=2621013 RepID=UPI00035FA96F|nr:MULTISPECIES: guanylate kinase [unclassified Thioalkalivibrio]